jgi:purine-nucleoside phosphorylase
MGKLRDEIEKTVSAIRKKTQFEPQIGIVLGTGLGQLAREIEEEKVLPYGEIPGFPISTVESHEGRLIFGHLAGKKVVAMQGRFHYYEGYSMEQIVFPVRVMKFLGAKALLVSNACGGMNPLFKGGDLMLITDHINMQGDNPLRGENADSIGPRFPDMFQCYDPELITLTEETALEEKIPLRKGIYVSLSGPNLETAAEYRMLRIIGADVVGMSTVPEVIAARHIGMKVLGLSVVTDMGLPDALGPMNLDKIIAVAEKTEPSLTRLMAKVIGKMVV